MVKHQHHIIPKHQGGSDDESNLIELSIADHAEAHRVLYEKYGHWEDYVAWQGLSGMIGKDELIRLVQSNASKDRIRIKGNPGKGIRTSGNWALNPELQRKAIEAAASEKSNAKRKATFKAMAHAQGSKNSQFGSRWITDGTVNKKISKSDQIPDSWRAGRVL